MEVVLGKLLGIWHQLKGKIKATKRRVGRSRKRNANNVKKARLLRYKAKGIKHCLDGNEQTFYALSSTIVPYERRPDGFLLLF
jgi:hypothetical protein